MQCQWHRWRWELRGQCIQQDTQWSAQHTARGQKWHLLVFYPTEVLCGAVQYKCNNVFLWMRVGMSNASIRKIISVIVLRFVFWSWYCGLFFEQPDVWDIFSQNKQALMKPGIWRKKWHLLLHTTYRLGERKRAGGQVGKGSYFWAWFYISGTCVLSWGLNVF
jgi:hypothetical protein